MATLDADDLTAIAALIDARLPSGFSTLTITGGQLDGLAGPVQATDSFGNTVASATNVAAIQAKTDQLTFLGGYLNANVRSITDVEGNQRSITSPGGSDGDPITIHQLAAATIADAVWDELLSGHATSGSAGAKLSEVGTATIYPLTGTVTATASASYIAIKTNEAVTVTVAVYDSAGTAVSTVGMTLELIFESGSSEVVIANADITKSTTGFSFTVPSTLNSSEKLWSYVCRKTTDESVIVSGKLEVTYAPNN